MAGDWIVVAATVVIAGFAVTNHLLSRAIKSASEQHQKEMNEILKAIGRAIAYLANSESRRETEKELKEAADKRAGNFSRKQ